VTTWRSRRSARAERPGLRRLPPVAALVLVLLLLAACSSIPTSGPVQEGLEIGSESGRGVVRALPLPPRRGEPPQQVVRGFLRAAVGYDDGHRVAREFLADAQRPAWSPGGRVLVYAGEGSLDVAVVDPAQAGAGEELDGGAEPGDDAGPAARGEPAAAAPSDAGEVAEVVVTVPTLATVDVAGRYAESSPGATQTLRFGLRRVGEDWRIAELDDGVALPVADFDLLFRRAALYFPDAATSSALVPDVRWVPSRASGVTTLVRLLLDGPSPWLERAVSTGFPAGTGLAIDAVPVVEGVATVDLTRQALRAGEEQRRMLHAQLEATLDDVPEVTGLAITAERAELTVPVAPQGPGAPRPTRPDLLRDLPVDPRPVLLADDELVRLDAGSLVPVQPLVPLAGADPSHPAPAWDGDTYAVLLDGRSRLVKVRTGDPPPEPEVVLDGADLTPPSFDRHGWLWSTPADVQQGIAAVGPEGTVQQVAAPWLAGRAVASLRLSRDGARVAVVSSGADGVRVDVAGVERTAERTPLRLGEPLRLAPALTRASAVAWVDEARVLVLGRAASDAAAVPYLVVVGGPSTPTAATPGGRSVAAGNGPRALYVGAADGVLLGRAGRGWVPVGPADVELREPSFTG
jgi:hypothetical protein